VRAHAEFSIEHERGDEEEEIEFQLKWALAEQSTSSVDDEPIV
jgi:hypothetical protein